MKISGAPKEVGRYELSIIQETPRILASAAAFQLREKLGAAMDGSLECMTAFEDISPVKV